MKTPHTRTVQCFALVAAASVFVSSCAPTSDGRVTQSQGAGLGAMGGALLGVGFGALTGMDSSQIGRAAAIGGAVGALGGLAYGTSVAKKKAQYAQQEDYLTFAIAEAEKRNSEAIAYNKSLATEVASLEKQVQSLPSNPTERSKVLSTSKKQMASTSKQIKKLDGQVSDMKQAISLVEAEGVKNQTSYSKLKSTASRLEKEKAVLEKYHKRIAAAEARAAA